jgi:hypothetical protein
MFTGMDVPWWSLVSIAVAALAGAGLNHIFSRRNESIKALREARIRWSVHAMEYRREVFESGAMWGEGKGAPTLRSDPGLQVLDPTGAELAYTMVYLHTDAEVRISNEWSGVGLVHALLPPQMEKLGRRLEQTIAQWAQVSWRMPLWRLRRRYARQIRREQLWTNDMHGSYVPSWRRRQRRMDARSFREFDKRLNASFRKRPWREKPDTTGLPSIACETCGRVAYRYPEALVEKAPGVEVIHETYTCKRKHDTIREVPFEAER